MINHKYCYNIQRTHLSMRSATYIIIGWAAYPSYQVLIKSVSGAISDPRQSVCKLTIFTFQHYYTLQVTFYQHSSSTFLVFRYAICCQSWNFFIVKRSNIIIIIFKIKLYTYKYIIIIPFDQFETISFLWIYTNKIRSINNLGYTINIFKT